MTQYLDFLWIVMIEDVSKETEEVVVEFMALVEVEFVMQTDGAYFCATIVVDRVTSVATAGIQEGCWR